MDVNSENTGNLPNPAPAPQAAVAQPAPAAAPQAPPSTPAGAQDSDRIEKEWILKTRQILRATASDPYEQAKQIAALRADYMAKRYNKVIKADN
jgi:hypothetical protein